MKPALEKALVSQTPTSAPITLPPPFGGWNARDPFVGMNSRYAIQMDNWIPRERNVEVRKGWREWQRNLDGVAQTLMTYKAADVDKLFAVTAAGTLWDVSSRYLTVPTVGPAATSEFSGLSNGLWDYVNFRTSGGAFMLAVNGTDDLLRYDGTTWTQPTDITGIDTSELIAINSHNRRIWMIEKASLSAWYLGTDSIAGALTEFPLGPVFGEGGALVAMVTWSVDAGDGVNDYAAFITDEGEVAVYSGTDPASAATWALVGVFRIPKPIGGARCYQKYGGDVLINTTQGIFPLTKALSSSTVNRTEAVTDIIAPAFTRATQQTGNLPGWEMELYSEDNLLIVNVPGESGLSAAQYVMNTVTNAWCRWLDIAAFSWATYQGQLMFGGDGFVGQALYGVSDNGDTRVATMVPAFSTFGADGIVKHVQLYRLLLQTTGDTDVKVALIEDFKLQQDFQEASIMFPLTGFAEDEWDEGVWDTAIWGYSYASPLEWRTVFGNPAHYISLALRVTDGSNNVALNATNVIVAAGSLM